MAKYKRVAVLGSHGYLAHHGGFETLVTELCNASRTNNVEYTVFCSHLSPMYERFRFRKTVNNFTLIFIPWSASGPSGLLYDVFSLVLSLLLGYRRLLFLGPTLIPFGCMLNRISFGFYQVWCNYGGVEWRRPNLSALSRALYKIFFKIGIRHLTGMILDNGYFLQEISSGDRVRAKVIPYGGRIDYSLNAADVDDQAYDFINSDFYLALGRSTADNRLAELCENFRDSPVPLVMISNFSSTQYGQDVKARFDGAQSVILIDGVYVRPLLDVIRRSCKAYIHSHTLSGSAPSLIEMIVSGRPICSVDTPQNRLTLRGECLYYKDEREIAALLEGRVPEPSPELQNAYQWDVITRQYAELYH